MVDNKGAYAGRGPIIPYFARYYLRATERSVFERIIREYVLRFNAPRATACVDHLGGSGSRVVSRHELF